MKTKLQTIAEYLECDVDQIEDDGVFQLGDREYLVLTEKEAYENAENYIKDTIWAFSPWFLSKHTGINEDIFELLQDKSEDSSEVITNSIKDMDEFIADAISEDGIGHFIADYNGEEEELNDFFIYRVG